ncbi:MAG TPA: ABC transporter permease [Xanthobacteraceae bacterium]|jgi:peptide/nickel transport system permease protein|nr:ABC transporter permease [Xanthobacteraceae bacterium]
MRIVALVLKRLAWLAPTLAGLVAIVFFISRVIPADPVALVAGETASRAQIELLRQKLGLDQPLIVQLAQYYKQLLSGDLGTSLFTTRPVWEDLSARLPATIELTVAAMLVSVVFGIPLGVVAALHRNRFIDHLLRVVTVAGLAVASFWLALLLQLLFAMDLRWLPLQARITGFPPPAITGFYVIDALIEGNFTRLGNVLAHLTLPALTLAFPALATVVRFTRAGVLETLQRSFVIYQRAMGIPAGLIVWKYVLRNSLISTVTQIGLLFGILLAGAVVIETVFQWPGIGAYAFEAILQSDYPGVMGFTLYAGFVFGIVNLIVDVGHAVLDPREAAT